MFKVKTTKSANMQATNQGFSPIRWRDSLHRNRDHPTLPQLPSAIDAHTTADYILQVIQGQALMPEAINTQVDCLIQALSA
jgi:hypothetical protein